MQKYVSYKYYYSQFVFAISAVCNYYNNKVYKVGSTRNTFALADLQFGEHTHAQINIVVTHCCSKYTTCLVF